MKLIKALLLTLLTSAIGINPRFANAQGEEKKIIVPATIIDGKVMPYIKLNVVDITALACKKESAAGYELPVVTIVASRTDGGFLPAVKYKGNYIAKKQLPVVEITGYPKKSSLASVFNFNAWFKKIKLF